MVRREDDRIRIYSRRGADFTSRFPRIVTSVGKLAVQSVLLDGEGIVGDEKGLARFDLILSKQHDVQVQLCAFDVLELNGTDLRPRPLSERKATLERLLEASPDGLQFKRAFNGRRLDHFATRLQM